MSNTLVTLDFETYFDDDYTLKKLTTSEYVRDRRFESISCAIKLDDQPTLCVFGDEIEYQLNKIDWSKATLAAHHTHFDGLILSHHYGHVPAKYACTLSMARGIFPKTERNDLNSVAQRLGKGNKLVMPEVKGKHLKDLTDRERADLATYNIADVDLCYEIYQELRDDLDGIEHRLIDTTVRMFADPALRLDKKRARVELDRLVEERTQLIAGSGLTEKQLGSSNQFAAALKEAGVQPPLKISPTTKKKIFAFAKTDLEFTSLQYHPDPKVSTLVKARLGVKSNIGVNRAARLLKSAKAGRLPVYLNYCGAHTTRWSGGDKMNYQNLPRGGELRKSLLAPPGHEIVVIDAAQIEARVLAWLAGEEWLLKAFVDGRDAYCEFASVAYSREITKADERERFVGKTCVLGLGYSMGAFKLRMQLLQKGVDLPLDLCEQLVFTYRNMNSNITGLWSIMNEVIHGMSHAEEGIYKCIEWGLSYIRLPNGMFLHYPGTDCESVLDRYDELRIYDGTYETYAGETKIYGGLLTENVVQALARVIVGWHAAQIAERYRIVLLTHDEIAFLARKAKAEQALEWGLGIMRTAPSWCTDLPLDAEGKHAPFYSK